MIARRNHIRALLAGMSARARQQRVLVMLQAYIDDSGNGDPPVYVLAGFVASSDEWEIFTDEWQALLDAPPRLEYFKMKEASVTKAHIASEDKATSAPQRTTDCLAGLLKRGAAD